MKIAIAGDISVADPNSGLQMRTGNIASQRLLDDEAPDGLNFWFVRNVFSDDAEEAFETPRHRHPFAQIKFIEKGSSNYVPGKDIEEGDVAYFPRAAYYGPQRKERCTSIGMQFGFNGQHQRGKRWEERRAETMERLNARGTVENGVFREKDPVTGEITVRDSVEALYDERLQLIEGRKLVVEPAGYEAPILMHPQAFPYFEAGPGVELKHLGKFFDQPGPNGDVRISMVRLSDGGVHTLSSERAQIAWTLMPGLRIGDRACPKLACLYSPRGEATDLSGDDGVEVYIVEFPRLD